MFYNSGYHTHATVLLSVDRPYLVSSALITYRRTPYVLSSMYDV